MAVIEAGIEGKLQLRCLTDEEMLDGLGAEAVSQLAKQAEIVRSRRALSTMMEKLGELQTLNEQIAVRRLVNGFTAYILLDGIDGIVRQMPDGTREVIRMVDGSPVVVRALPPATTTASETEKIVEN